MRKEIISLEEHIRLWTILANPSVSAEEKERANLELWDMLTEASRAYRSKEFDHQEEQQVFPLVFPEMAQIPLRLWEEQPKETQRKLCDQLTVYLKFWEEDDADDPWEARERLMRESNLHPWGGLDEILMEKHREEEEEDEEEPEDEVPFVTGEWARMRRRFLQVQRPQEWKRMLEEQEASAYLTQIEEHYQEQYRRMCEREEERIPQEELTFLENVQRRNAIGQMVKEFLMEDLQH